MSSYFEIFVGIWLCYCFNMNGDRDIYGQYNKKTLSFHTIASALFALFSYWMVGIFKFNYVGGLEHHTCNGFITYRTIWLKHLVYAFGFLKITGPLTVCGSKLKLFWTVSNYQLWLTHQSCSPTQLCSTAIGFKSNIGE